MTTRLAACAAFVLALLPAVAQACAVCGGYADRNRAAFLGTTILLSLLPLGLIGGAIWWLRRTVLRHERFEVTDSSAAPGPRAR
jgi:high-affinity Fe2+/Pb2+ permease